MLTDSLGKYQVYKSNTDHASDIFILNTESKHILSGHLEKGILTLITDAYGSKYTLEVGKFCNSNLYFNFVSSQIEVFATHNGLRYNICPDKAYKEYEALMNAFNDPKQESITETDAYKRICESGECILQHSKIIYDNYGLNYWGHINFLANYKQDNPNMQIIIYNHNTNTEWTREIQFKSLEDIMEYYPIDKCQISYEHIGTQLIKISIYPASLGNNLAEMDIKSIPKYQVKINGIAVYFMQIHEE